MDTTPEDVGPELIVPGVARALSPLVRRILALNAGARTGIGTNTYLIGIDEIVVVDPGPDDINHLDSVAGCGGDRIRWITWTQSGPDYTGGLDAMIERTGAEVLDLADRETILGTEFRVTCHAMGGPSADHRTFMLEEERMLLCGGLMAEDRPAPLSPDADLAQIRESILAASKMRLRRIAPVHGYVIEEPKKAIPAELELRDAIDASLIDALASAAATVDDLVETLHPGLDDDEARAMAADSITAHLNGLLAAEKVKESGGTWATA